VERETVTLNAANSGILIKCPTMVIITDEGAIQITKKNQE